jgi:hypothetical protein
MTLPEFSELVARGIPPAADVKLLHALWADARGNWDLAHTIAQGVDGQDGARVHAYLHRKEGDFSNARYWYTRAGIDECRASLQEEWEELVRRCL